MSVIARLDRSRACPTSALNCRNRKHPISMRSSNPGAAFEIRSQSWWLLDAPLEAGHDTHSIPLFSAVSLVRERVGSKLEMNDHRLASLAAFLEPRGSVAAAGPQSSALPAGIRVIDASIEALGIEAKRIGHAQRNHLAVLERNQAVVEVAGRHRHVIAQPERVVLVDPAVVARLGAVVADAFEAWARVFGEFPTLGTMIAGGIGAVERPFAQAPVKAADMAARERYPDDPLAVDIAAARTVARQRDVVDFRQRCRGRVGARIDANDRSFAA